MKTKQVTRYTCEFCGKTGYSLGSMRKHEAHCTLNPKRECRMCEAEGNWNAPTPEELAAVVAMIPRLDDFKGDGFIDMNEPLAALKRVWDTIEDRLHGCPACIMAALRQAKFPLPAIDWWNYTDACKEFWEPINEAKTEGIGYW